MKKMLFPILGLIGTVILFVHNSPDPAAAWPAYMFEAFAGCVMAALVVVPLGLLAGWHLRRVKRQLREMGL